MSRFLQWFNLFGILALAALCAVQWRANRRLNLDLRTKFLTHGGNDSPPVVAT